MIPVLNEIFFLLTSLFGLQVPIFAETVQVSINFESESGIIEFRDLKTTERALIYAEEEIKTLRESEQFQEYFDMVILDSLVIFSNEGHLDARLSFSIENVATFLSTFRFNTDVNGQPIGTKWLQYQLLPLEVLRSSNAREVIGKDIPLLEWNKNVKEIQFEIGHSSGIDEFWGKMAYIRPI